MFFSEEGKIDVFVLLYLAKIRGYMYAGKRLWIWIWMGNFISTASLQFPVRNLLLFIVTC